MWRRYDATEARLTAPLSARMADLAGRRPGMRVLDLATGRGEPAMVAARRVSPNGTVVGVDPSGDMLAMARERAAREGVSNLDLHVTSAESLEVPAAHFDATLVRWGLMYMDAPVAALATAHRAMVPAGVLVAAVWVEPERVPYFSLPRRILAKYRALPGIDAEAPGTFRYADLRRLERDLGEAGFRVEHVEEMEVSVMEAHTGAEVVEWVRAFGLATLVDEMPAEAREAWEIDLVNAAEALRKAGTIRLGGVTRIVVCRCDG
jgi:ubiquinone/menaquinone biosynthesis C-methylase UbiE